MTSIHKPIVFLSLLFVLLTNGRQAKSEVFSFFHENVLGTSMELHVQAPSAEIAWRTEEVALKEIDRLSEVFSHYSKSSEFAKLLDLEEGASIQVSSELAQLLHRCDSWRDLSLGAFNPGVELLSRHWRNAAGNNAAPSPEVLSGIVDRVNQRHWKVQQDSNTVMRFTSVPLSLNAIAKGTILDSVVHVVTTRFPELEGVSLNIGGDIRISGDCKQRVSIPNPNCDALESKPLQTVTLIGGAIATSGVSERSLTIDGRGYSHIIDPKTGRTCNHVASASVIASDAETADVLATICSVLPVSASIGLIESIPGAKCLLVDCNGALIASSLWPTEGFQEPGKTDQKAEEVASEFNIAFEINKASEGGRYRRPYVAVWIEDKDGFPVKTLSLFLMTDNPGPRWHRDLRRWYASDQMRLVVDQKKLIGTVSKPTRNPGSYKIAWDGTDDNGKLLPDGKYTFYVEAAREHGTYQLMKSSFSLGTRDFELKLDGNIEIKSASMAFKKSK